ncbi:hypothetical protein Lser_V15G39899 [Lactuca serriola]
MAEDRSSKRSSTHRFSPLSAKRQPRVQKYRSMADILKTANQAVVNYGDIDDVICIQCGSGGKNQQLILCGNCNQPYHKRCLRLFVRHPTCLWHCRSCFDLPPPAKFALKLKNLQREKLQSIEHYEVD